ncbi:MAG: hypothetical protein GKR97_14920 [Rhizobiaceae bacterium]|nr:hypothetical protein [Rhizobiaceae bacterium]
MYDPQARQKRNRSELRSLVLFIGTLLLVFVIFVQPVRFDLSVSNSQCQQLNKLWRDKYQTEFEYSKAWNRAEFECPSIVSGLVGALNFLENLDIQQSAKPEQGGDFYRRLKRQSPLLDHDLLFSHAGNTVFETRQITLNNIVLADNNPVQIAGILMHEMRHLEEGINTHVPCQREPEKSCDAVLLDGPEQGGAYNFNIYFLHLVRHYSNASELHRKLARREMQTIFDVRFNQMSEAAPAFYQLEVPQWMSAAQ